MIRFICLAIAVFAACVSNRAANTIATFNIHGLQKSVGIIELEFFDQEKPVTVSNFIKYVQSGRYSNSFIHRWVTNFVFQGGGFMIGRDATGKQQIQPVQTFGEITNEYRSGTVHSNVYGTIAMARQGGKTNSATSQWFISAKDNLFLDAVDGGFTVFGRVISGTNVVNKFVAPPPVNGIYKFALDNGVFSDLPVLEQTPTYEDLLYFDISLRRDVGLKVARGRTGRTLTWITVASVSNVVEFSTNFPPRWQTFTNIMGSGNVAAISDPTSDRNKIYRLKLLY